jgi:transcriptional regulator with GAF, ATPase, and Fis domain
MAQATRIRTPVETIGYTRVRVAVTRGPDTGQVIDSAGVTLTVGTGTNADLRLSDDTVSREHCEIQLTEHGFRVRDRNSTNGLRVGNVRVYDMASVGPVEVSLGDTTLSLTPLDETEERSRASVASFGRLLGEAPKMRELFALLASVAPTELSVLIEGETGTGKELVAQSIHAASARAERELVVLDCSAVHAGLMDSVLFGHKRGAFTGASGNVTGLLERAHGGTLFLDELGELPIELQLKLLRAMESGEFRPIGAARQERVDVRVIAATNRNLKAAVAAGSFRQDLYYRLEGLLVSVPPLRERLEDIPMLVDHFLRLEDPSTDRSALPAHALEMFQNHRWPGNVRELRNVVRRMRVLPDWSFRADCAPPADDAQTQLERNVLRHLRAWIRDPDAANRSDWLPLTALRSELEDAFELDYLQILKRVSGGNKTRAGAIAGVTRQAIQNLARKHQFDWSDSADAPP